ncbi:hypothetical protein [Patulibacter sp. SYSU D01012]|uniref:hypothetical protein n=1 Tax=Patulibacter sp. SYSU D01012 TaxID=2817381 RepID=UPI001B311CA8|nr:hypothetical protein [Patulibacter sp. SYSU D01012]
MSRPRLARLVVALLAALAVGGTTVAPAGASDATLRAAIKKQDRASDKALKKIEEPAQDSPTFAADYATFVEQVNGVLTDYRKGIRKERASTAKGRKARTLMISSITTLQETLRTMAEVLARTPNNGEAQASPEDQKRLEDALEEFADAAKDNVRAYKLLGMKPPKGAKVQPATETSA